MNLPFIDMFDYEGLNMIHAMYDLTVEVFEHIDITPRMDFDLRIKYM